MLLEAEQKPLEEDGIKQMTNYETLRDDFKNDRYNSDHSWKFWLLLIDNRIQDWNLYQDIMDKYHFDNDFQEDEELYDYEELDALFTDNSFESWNGLESVIGQFNEIDLK